MRWKWLLVLSLLAISLVAVSADDDVESEDKVNDNYDEEVEEEKDEVKDEEVAQTDAVSDGDPSVDTAAASDDEDTVDVDSGTVAVGKQKGKYMNYDDYFVASAIDGSDSSYNWNGEWPNPSSLDWHIIANVRGNILVTTTLHLLSYLTKSSIVESIK